MMARENCGMDKNDPFHTQQHAIMKSSIDYGYSGMDNSTQVCHILQGIKSPELEAAINIVCLQSEKHGTDVDANSSYLG